MSEDTLSQLRVRANHPLLPAHSAGRWSDIANLELIELQPKLFLRTHTFKN